MFLQIFVSYSRIDKDIVVPIAKVLRLSAEVFRDEDSLTPGTRWKEEIDRRIDESDIVIVFWSRAASDSKNVEKEYYRAIDKSKDVVPLLLDDTPLSSPLMEYQWLDFRPFLQEAAKRGIQDIVTSTHFALGAAGLIPGVSVALLFAPFIGAITKIRDNGWPMIFDEDSSNEMLKSFSARINRYEKLSS